MDPRLAAIAEDPARQDHLALVGTQILRRVPLPAGREMKECNLHLSITHRDPAVVRDIRHRSEAHPLTTQHRQAARFADGRCARDRP